MDIEWTALVALSLSAYAILVYTVSLGDFENVYVTSVLLLTAVVVGWLAMALRPLLARVAFMRSDYVLKCDPNDNCTVSMIAPGKVSGKALGSAVNEVLDVSLTMLASCSAFFAARVREEKDLQSENEAAATRPELYGITLASWAPTMALAIHGIYANKDSPASMAFAMALGSLVGTTSQVVVGNSPTYNQLKSR